MPASDLHGPNDRRPKFRDGVLRALCSWETAVATACHMLAYFAVASEFGNLAGLAVIIPVNLAVRVILSLDQSTGRR